MRHSLGHSPWTACYILNSLLTLFTSDFSDYDFSVCKYLSICLLFMHFCELNVFVNYMTRFTLPTNGIHFELCACFHVKSNGLCSQAVSVVSAITWPVCSQLDFATIDWYTTPIRHCRTGVHVWGGHAASVQRGEHRMKTVIEGDASCVYMTLLHAQQHRANEPLDRRSICDWGVVRRQVHSARLNVDIIYSWASKERRVDGFRRPLPSVSADQRHGTGGRHVASSSCCCCCCCCVCTVWNITSLNHRRSTNRYIFVSRLSACDKSRRPRNSRAEKLLWEMITYNCRSLRRHDALCNVALE